MAFELFPYQEIGVKWLVDHPDKVAGLFDDPGLGKTAQVIEAIRQLGLRNVLVICPAVARSVWVREIERQAPGLTVIAADRYAHMMNADITVVTYNKMTRDKEIYTQLPMHDIWDLIVCDESHYLKTPGTKRTEFVFGRLINCTDRMWLLTGTPTPRDTRDIFTTATAAKKIPTSSFDCFTRHFCTGYDTEYGFKVTGNRNTNELKGLLKGLYLRRTTKEVLPELPDLQIDTYPIKLTKMPPMPDDIAHLDVDALEHHSTMAPYRRALGHAKVKAAIDIAAVLAATGHKTLIFAWHRDVMVALNVEAAKRHLNPVSITGSTALHLRNERVDRFQNDPDCMTLIGQIMAAGTAISATVANQVLMVEADWVPDNNFQAIKRAHRIGQKDHVLARFLVGEDNPVDAKMMRTLAARTRAIKEVWS